MLKNKGLFFIGIVLSSFLCSAQNTDTKVISPAGGNDKTENVSIDWTLGEPAVKTVDAGDMIITEGYHQPVLKVISNEVITPASNYKFQIAPNPVRSILNFKSASEEKNGLNVRLTDINGKILLVLSAAANDSKDIDMSQLGNGIYLLSISNSDGNVIETFRVIKTQ
jgi:hypothetical protein